MATNSEDTTADDSQSMYVTNAAVSSTRTVYHCTKDCPRVQKPERYRDRDERYVEFHDLDPCPYCHDDLDRPINGTAGDTGPD